MTGKETNSYKPFGKRSCHICTGCGRCEGSLKNLQILTENRLHEEAVEGGFLAAADIGTTTIAMVLYNEKGQPAASYVSKNPQAEYGADVLSRIEAAADLKTAKEMQQMVRAVLEQGLREFGKVTKKAFPLAIAANTTMIYLLMGWNPTELGRAPFHATYLEEIRFTILDTPTVILPGLSAFTGADTVAGIYACNMWREERTTLFLDLGTNGELAMGNKDGITLCSTAAGPAFEGAGIWGADMIKLTARLLQEGIVDKTGLLCEEWFEEGIRIGGVLVTQKALRSLQLAKGAVAAGIKILLREETGKALEADRVILAGGFGYYLNPKEGADIGLLPKSMVSKAAAGGNTALAGAYLYGRDAFGRDASGRDADRAKTADFKKWIREKTRIINLAAEKDFNELYVGAMNFQAF